MIDKFKKGGQNTSILAKIQQLPKEQQQQVMQAFSQWAQQKGVDIQKLQKDPNALEQALGQFMQELQSQKTQAARHGAKLNYLKSLKNKCAEDEELVYFKKGGSIDCGCKKKEVGGKVQSAQNGAVAKFKNDKKTNQIKWTDKDEKKLDSLSTREGMNKPLTPQGKKDLKNLREKFKKSSNTKDYEVEEGKKGTKINKICGGSVISKFKAKCGSKLKKHQQGGSLNGIPFMQKGSSFKEAWNNARKNKVRYFNYNGRMYNSKATGVDNEYNTFRDNMNEMSALLPTDNSPKHLGWERNNPISNELRDGDRQIRVQGTESTLPEVTITGNVHTKKSPTKSSIKSEVYYNMPLGRIEYIGRDGQRYWMAQSDANGQWYYDKIENSANYGPKYHKAVPEGYIIPGTNTPITKNSKIGKIGLGLKKKWMKNGGSLKHIPLLERQEIQNLVK